MLRETTLIQLPAPLSKAIDEAVDGFVQSHESENLKCYNRWQGADLWMVFRDQVGDAEEAVVITHRVTIAAYSDDPGRLVFIPDVVRTAVSGGRYVLEETYRASLVQRLAEQRNPIYVHEALWVLTSPRQDWLSRLVDVRDIVGLALEKSWRLAQALKASEATIRLP